MAVIVAILRTQPPGDFQKLLADALTRAPAEHLVGADLQRANLQNAWLGEIELPGADFFRADLSNASFKDGGVERAQFYEARLARTRFTRARLDGANFFGADLSRASFDRTEGRGISLLEASARRAVFRDAQLAGAVFTGADLRGADFSGADLERAEFEGARLEGALFGAARNVPDEIVRRLDAQGRHRGTAARRSSARRVFLSEAAVATPQCQALVDRVALLIEQSGATIVRLRRADYPVSGSFAEVRRLIGGCAAAAIVGVPQLSVAAGTFRPGTPEEAPVSGVALATPWNQIEAGMAIALDLPVLIIRSRVDDGGIFAIKADASAVSLIDVDDRGPISDLDDAVESWLRTLTSF